MIAATRSGPRVLLCRPTGGLTDMLCQIGRCITYARLHQRQLVIDTNLREFYAEPLDHYLFPGRNLACEVVMPSDRARFLNQLDCHPAPLAGRLERYQAEQIPPDIRDVISLQLGHFTNLRDSESKIPLSFDFRSDHQVALLVHHCSGNPGVGEALTALTHLWPKPDLRQAIRQRLHHLPTHYDALHIRHTDLLSDLDAAFARSDIPSSVPLLVASDSHDAVTQAEARIKRRPLLIGSRPVNPAVHGLAAHATTHKAAADLPRSTINQAAWIDLMVLAKARRLVTAPLLPGQCKGRSGFFELARALQHNTTLLGRFIH